MVEIICRELTSAWQSVGLSFSFEKRQVQTQVARIMSVNEKTLCLTFEIRMPQGSGMLNLAFPAVVANTILRRLTSDWGRRHRHASETRARIQTKARRISLGGSVQLPSVHIAAREIESLGPDRYCAWDSPPQLKLMACGGANLGDCGGDAARSHRGARVKHLSKVEDHEHIS